MARIVISSLLVLVAFCCFACQLAIAGLNFGILTSNQVSQKMMEHGNNSPQQRDCVRFGVGLFHELGLTELNEHSPGIHQTVAEFLHDFVQPSSMSSIKMNERMAMRTRNYLMICLEILKTQFGLSIPAETAPAGATVEDENDHGPGMLGGGVVSPFAADVEKHRTGEPDSEPNALEGEPQGQAEHGEREIYDFDYVDVDVDFDVEADPEADPQVHVELQVEPTQTPAQPPTEGPEPRLRAEVDYLGRRRYHLFRLPDEAWRKDA